MPARPQRSTTIDVGKMQDLLAALPSSLAAAAKQVASSDPSPKGDKHSPRVRRSKSYDQALAEVKARSAEVVARKALDYEARILQDSFPFWDDDNRGVPKPLSYS